MGLLVQNNNISLSDGAGNVRFTTEKRMPHLLFSASGTIYLPNIPAIAQIDGDGNAVSLDSNVATDYPILSDSRIAQLGAFVMPFYSISGGDMDTAGSSVSASGSVALHLLTDSSGYFVGTRIISPVIVGNVLNFRVSSSLSGYPAQGWTLYDMYTGQADIPNTAITINYRVYYGRFS